MPMGENPLLIGVLVVCILPAISMAILGFVAFRFGKRQLDNLVDPNVDKLYAQYTAMYQQNPDDADTERMVRKIIHQQAVKCGIVGAVTGIGGFITLPITLPIDYVLSVRIQSTMVRFIARTYGQEEATDARAANYMIMTGSGQVTQMSQRVLMRYSSRILGRFMGKFASKIIPFIGAGVGFLVNYTLARSTGRLALRWYGEKHQRLSQQQQQQQLT